MAIGLLRSAGLQGDAPRAQAWRVRALRGTPHNRTCACISCPCSARRHLYAAPIQRRTWRSCGAPFRCAESMRACKPSRSALRASMRPSATAARRTCPSPTAASRPRPSRCGPRRATVRRAAAAAGPVWRHRRGPLPPTHLRIRASSILCEALIATTAFLHRLLSGPRVDCGILLPLLGAGRLHGAQVQRHHAQGV
jgi:hypothetical protein